MGRNIFVSYKFADTNVQRLSRTPWYETTKARDYVDELSELLNQNGHVYMGEGSDEDLSGYSDDYIYNHLKDKIYPTSVTIVLISPNMKEPHRLDKSQWVPWEIFYSIYQANRQGRVSHTNAILAVVLPDQYGSYSYMIEHKNCCPSGCRLLHTDKLFTILQKNMFNQKEKTRLECRLDDNVYRGFCSYIPMVKWCDFIQNIDSYLWQAEYTRDHIEEYEMHRSVNKE